jgi:hypothetical protein
MRVRVRFGYRDIRNVDVSDSGCPLLDCFVPARHTIRSCVGASGCAAQTTNNFECRTREDHSCPNREQREKSDPPLWRKINGAWERRN